MGADGNQHRSADTFLPQLRVLSAGVDLFSSASGRHRATTVSASSVFNGLDDGNSLFLRLVLLAHVFDDSLRRAAGYRGLFVIDTGCSRHRNLAHGLILAPGSFDHGTLPGFHSIPFMQRTAGPDPVRGPLWLG